MKRTLTTDYGLKAIITDDINDIAKLDNPMIDKYHRITAQAQKDNCGYYILDTENHFPIDNEYDLDAIYGMLKSLK